MWQEWLTIALQQNSVFVDKLVVDDRQPVWTFDFGTSSYVLLPPKAALWMQIVVVTILQGVLFQTVAAIVNYHCIVLDRTTTTTTTTTKQPSLLCRRGIIGWGLMIPLTLYLPFATIQYLGIYNRIVKLAAIAPTSILAFRTVEAMYGTARPVVVESSLSTYMAYYSSIVPFDWDVKTGQRRKITLSQLACTIVRLMGFSLASSLLLSYELHHQFVPFDSTADLNSFTFGTHLLSPAHLANAYLLVVTVYLTLAGGLLFTALGEQLKGFATKPIFCNPLWGSRSPRDFWSRRWDRLFQTVLRQGVFLPTRPYLSAPWAIVVTFLVSGLYHEYLTYGIAQCPAENTLCEYRDFEFRFCKVTAFFVWNAVVVVVLERPLGDALFAWTRHLPTVVVSTMVVCTALPVSHWFTGDWTQGFLQDLSVGMWLIKKS